MYITKMIILSIFHVSNELKPIVFHGRSGFINDRFDLEYILIGILKVLAIIFLTMLNVSGRLNLIKFKNAVRYLYQKLWPRHSTAG